MVWKLRNTGIEKLRVLRGLLEFEQIGFGGRQMLARLDQEILHQG